MPTTTTDYTTVKAKFPLPFGGPSLIPGNLVSIPQWVKKSHFQLAPQISTPMIGTLWECAIYLFLTKNPSVYLAYLKIKDSLIKINEIWLEIVKYLMEETEK